MAGKVQIKIDVDSESVEFATDRTLTLTEKTRLLKKELQTVPEGTKEWHILNNTFNDTKDALDRVNTKSKDIFGTFSLLPGPIGQISNSLEQTIDTFKIFGSLKTTDLKAQIGNLWNDFKDMGKTIGNLTGITKVYTVINNALSKSFIAVGVGEQAAAVGARAFSAALVATGVGALVVGLGYLVSKLMEYTTNTEEATTATDQLTAAFARNKKAQSDRISDLEIENKLRIASLKKAGASEEEIRKETIENARKLYNRSRLDEINTAIQLDQAKINLQQVSADKSRKAELENAKKVLDDANDAHKEQLRTTKSRLADLRNAQADAIKADADAAKTATDKANQKAEAQRAKTKAERERELEELKKGNEEAFKETLTAKQKEEYEVNDKYKKLIALAEKYGMDTIQLKKGQAEALAKITDKYNKEDEEKEKKLQEERLKKLEDYLNKEQKLRDSKRENQAQKAQQAIAKQLFDGLITEKEYQDKSLASNLEFAMKKQTDDETTYNANKLALDKLYENKGISQQQYEEKSAENQATYDQQKLDNDVAVTDASLAIDQNAFDRRKALAEASVEVEKAAAESKAAIQFAYADAVGMVGNLLSQFAGKNKGLAKAGVILEQGANVAKILIGASSSIAQQTAAANAQAAIFPPLAPVIFANLARGIITTKIGAAIGVVGAIAGAAKGIADIDSADVGGGGSSSGAGGAAAATGSKFANGGLLSGRDHASGGIKTPYGELEGGEFVINKRSTQSFLPLLAAINASGNRNNNQGGNSVSMDAVQTMMMNQQQPIVKTYVVASDIYSQAQADKKLSDLARL